MSLRVWSNNEDFKHAAVDGSRLFLFFGVACACIFSVGVASVGVAQAQSSRAATATVESARSSSDPKEVAAATRKANRPHTVQERAWQMLREGLAEDN